MSAESGTKATILVVDDDADLRALVGLWLEAEGFELCLAEDAQQALQIADQLLPDLIVTDLVMPGLDGLQLMEQLRHRDPTVPMIMFSGEADVEQAVAATCQGIDHFLTKPLDRERFVAAVHETLSLLGPRKQFSDGDAIGDIVFRGTAMHRLMQQVERVAQVDSSVLIQGDSGSGKELVAQAIHRASARAEQPFIAVNCGAIPEPLLESELFGHEKGSFTGALKASPGLFRSAHGGTLFLDEIGDMPLALQVRLLRVLQERKVRAVGSSTDVAVDVRVISATHQDLQSAVAEKRFREDLYYRIRVVPLKVPALVERREDVPALAEHALKRLAARFGQEKKRFSREAMLHLAQADWPGNVRQLVNVVEQCVVLASAPVIGVDLVDMALEGKPASMPSLEQAMAMHEREYLIGVLRIANGNVTTAAKLAGRNRTDFYNLLNRHGLEAGSFR